MYFCATKQYFHAKQNNKYSQRCLLLQHKNKKTFLKHTLETLDRHEFLRLSIQPVMQLTQYSMQRYIGCQCIKSFMQTS